MSDYKNLSTDKLKEMIQGYNEQGRAAPRKLTGELAERNRQARKQEKGED